MDRVEVARQITFPRNPPSGVTIARDFASWMAWLLTALALRQRSYSVSSSPSICSARPMVVSTFAYMRASSLFRCGQRDAPDTLELGRETTQKENSDLGFWPGAIRLVPAGAGGENPRPSVYLLRDLELIVGATRGI